MQWNPSFKTTQKWSLDPHSEHCFLAPSFLFLFFLLWIWTCQNLRSQGGLRQSELCRNHSKHFHRKKHTPFPALNLRSSECSHAGSVFSAHPDITTMVTYLLSFRGPLCQCWTVQAKPASKCFVTFLRTAVLHGILGDKHRAGHTQRTRQAQQLYWLDPRKRFPTYCHEQLLQQQQKHESTILLLSTNQLLQTMP